MLRRLIEELVSEINDYVEEKEYSYTGEPSTEMKVAMRTVKSALKHYLDSLEQKAPKLRKKLAEEMYEAASGKVWEMATKEEQAMFLKAAKVALEGR